MPFLFVVGCSRNYSQTQTMKHTEQKVPVIYGREPTPAERDAILSACENWANQESGAQLGRALGNAVGGLVAPSAMHLQEVKTKQQLMADCWHAHVVL